MLPSVKKVILISNLNLLWGNLRPCPLSLSLYATAQCRISLCCVPERSYTGLASAVQAGATGQVHGLVSWTLLEVRGIPTPITPDFEAMLWLNYCPASHSLWWVLYQLLPCKEQTCWVTWQGDPTARGPNSPYGPVPPCLSVMPYICTLPQPEKWLDSMLLFQQNSCHKNSLEKVAIYFLHDVLL